MTPEQRALRDAFLAECWKPVPEWHPTKDERRNAKARNKRLDETRGNREPTISEAS